MGIDSGTIFGLATPPPSVQGSGIGIIRISGPGSISVAGNLIKNDLYGDEIPFREFKLATLSFEGKDLDRCGVIFFNAPNSYTGEDVVELHVHGGLAVIRSVENALIKLGARPAEPGEFTRRAFLNARLDLLQAESIAALIGAAGGAAQREALRQRSGTLSDKVTILRAQLRDVLSRMEVDFDYPEERPDGIETDEAVGSLKRISNDINPLLESWDRGRMLKGFRLAIIGLPNVGKSSLLNALLMEDRAIVTSSPGTTRDVVSASLAFGGVPAELLDTAGLRLSDDSIETAEAEGIKRSWREVERAHLILMVFDTSIPISEENSAVVAEARVKADKSGAAILLVCNKSDLDTLWEPSKIAELVDSPELPHVIISAKTGEGIDQLRSRVREMMNLDISPDEILLTEVRHRALLEETNGIIDDVRKGLSEEIPQDVAATELWGADRSLGRLLGEGLGAADLDEIFSRFCIGK